MAAKTMWPINYSFTNFYTQGLENIPVKFPLNLSSRSGEEDFVGFRVNPIWLPNHVTYDITWVNVLFLMDRRSYDCGAGRRPRARPLDGAAESARPITRNLDCTFSEKSEKYGSLIGPWRVNISTTWYRVIHQFSKYLEAHMANFLVFTPLTELEWDESFPCSTRA